MCAKILCSSRISANMSRAFRARLSASKAVLEAACSDVERVQISKIQVLALIDQLNREQLSAETAADLTDAIQHIGFASVYKKMLIDKIEKSLRVRPQHGRRELQNYQSVLGFFTQLHWSKMMDAQANAITVRDIIIRHVVALGCVNPSEHTSRLLNSLWILLTEGVDNALYGASTFGKYKSERTSSMP